jgi:ribosomal protein S2
MNTNGDDTSVTNMIPANTNSVKSTEYIASAIKKELVGTKVKSSGGKIQKMAPKKVSGEKKAPVKKVAKTEEK